MEKIRIRDKHPGSATLAVTVDTTKVEYTVHQNLPYASINIRDDVKHDNFLQMKNILVSPHIVETPAINIAEKNFFVQKKLTLRFLT